MKSESSVNTHIDREFRPSGQHTHRREDMISSLETESSLSSGGAFVTAAGAAANAIVDETWSNGVDLVAPHAAQPVKLPLLTYELPKSEIASHWMKIAIVVEQRRAVFDAPGPDQEVDCLADCDPAPT
jgi:hypothetical protein